MLINFTGATLSLLVERSRRNCQVAVSTQLCFLLAEDSGGEDDEQYVF